MELPAAANGRGRGAESAEKGRSGGRVRGPRRPRAAAGTAGQRVGPREGRGGARGSRLPFG